MHSKYFRVATLPRNLEKHKKLLNLNLGKKNLEKPRILEIKKKWDFEQKSLKNLKKHVIFINF